MSTRERYLLTERDTRQIEVPEEDIQFLEAQEEFTVHRRPSESVDVVSDRHVGVVGLPSGKLIEIEPKAPCNLLHYLAYVDRLDEEIVTGADVSIQGGDSFIELIAKLFLSEVDTVLKRGLKQEYITQESEEQYLRGQLDLQKQLRRQGPGATSFECKFDELSREIVENKILIDTVARLRQLVDSENLQSDLNRYYGRLAQQVSHQPMNPADFGEVTFNRLNGYYENALKLAELIFRQEYVEDLRGLDRQFSSLLINMESTFENVVVKAVKNVAKSNRFDVRTTSYGSLLTTIDGVSRLDLRPDFYMWDRDLREVVLVGDAKWKINTDPKRSDLYQIAAYQAKYGVPGLLVYPDLGGSIEQSMVYDEEKGTAAGRGPLTAVELQTGGLSSYDNFKQTIENSLHSAISGHMTSSITS